MWVRSDRVGTAAFDLHAHPLPGFDDGPPDLEGSLALARAALADGTSTMVATPHIDHLHGVAPADVAPAVAALNLRLRAEGLPLQVLVGGEVSLAMLEEAGPRALDPVRLGGGPFILLDTPLDDTVPRFAERAFRLVVAGERIALAHPERAPGLRGDLEGMARLIDAGCVAVANAGSLTGQFGTAAQRAASTMLRHNLIHALASDAHDARRRPPAISQAFTPAASDLDGLEAHRRWLTRAAPMAILDGARLPERPVTPIRRRSRFGRMGRR